MASKFPKKIINYKTIFIKVKDNKNQVLYEEEKSIKKKSKKTFVSIHRRRKIDYINFLDPWEVLFLRDGKKIMGTYLFKTKTGGVKYAINFLKRKRL